MVRSSSVTMNVRPTFEDVEHALFDVFRGFGVDSPKQELRGYGLSATPEIYVYGSGEDKWAWLVFYRDEYDVSGVEPTIIVDIQSRGDDIFAALVCFSILKFFGEKIFDDAGYLAAGSEFTSREWESLLKRRMGLDN